MLGDNQYRAIDVDKLYVGNWMIWDGESINESGKSRDKLYLNFIQSCLKLLGLPADYAWVIKSGSHNGFHIIIKAKDIEGFNIDTLSYSPNSNFRPSDDYREVAGGEAFLRMELRWNDYLVLPPSLHSSGNLYEFYFNKIPTSVPSEVSIDSLNKLIDYFCADDEYIDCKYDDNKIYLVRRVKKIENFSSRYFNGILRETIEDDYNWLMECYSEIALNTLGVAYLLGKGVKANIAKAKACLEQAKSPHSHFNLANLIACGCIEGDFEKVNMHLSFCPKIPSEYQELIKTNGRKNLPLKKDPYYLFFDTETTGVPENYKAPINDLKNWPRLVQIAWILCDEKGNIIEYAEHIVKPNGFIIPKDATSVHGISTERAMKEGRDLKDVLIAFTEIVKDTKVIVGHNISFDINIAGAELLRTGINCLVQNKNSICTMKSTVNFCALPGKYGYKWATLEELHLKLFGKSFSNAHSAMSDIKATKDCFFELKSRKLI